eukprot:g432.t1
MNEKNTKNNAGDDIPTASMAESLSKHLKRSLRKVSRLGSEMNIILSPSGEDEEERWEPQKFVIDDDDDDTFTYGSFFHHGDDEVGLEGDDALSVASSTETTAGWRAAVVTPPDMSGFKLAPSRALTLKLASDSRKRRFILSDDDAIAYRISSDFAEDMSNWLRQQELDSRSDAEREAFAAHLAKVYIGVRLSKLQPSKIVRATRKDIEKMINRLLPRFVKEKNVDAPLWEKEERRATRREDTSMDHFLRWSKLKPDAINAQGLTKDSLSGVEWVCKVCGKRNAKNTGKCAVCGRLPSSKPVPWKLGKHRPRKVRMKHLYTFNRHIGEKLSHFDDSVPSPAKHGLEKEMHQSFFPAIAQRKDAISNHHASKFKFKAHEKVTRRRIDAITGEQYMETYSRPYFIG